MVDLEIALDKAFLTVEETAEIIGLGRSMTYRLVREGKIPSVKLGAKRGLRIPSPALRKWIESRVAESLQKEADSDSHDSPI